jgi:hypothetical protein
MTDNRDIHYLTVRRDSLADVLRGNRPSNPVPFGPQDVLPRVGGREVLVFWSRNCARPCAIGVSDDDRQELFNWAFSFHRDLSPLTSWCHILSLREAQRFGSRDRNDADLMGLEAAWAGAAIAEAMILSRRDFELITLPACLATDTFAIARTAALYGSKAALGEIIETVDTIRDRLKRSAERWRPSSSHVISVLIRLLPDAPSASSRLVDLFTQACRHLRLDTKESKIPKDVLRQLILQVPHLSSLESLDELSAEDRVKLLREMKVWLDGDMKEEDRHVLYFCAGYVISKIGGAERDLRLAQNFEAGYPNVLTWATVIGGLGATTYWADAFGGIGRLVARELSRSLQIYDHPIADIGADELMVIGEKETGARRFRTAQRQVVSVSVRPGVVVQIGIADDDRGAERLRETERASVPRTGSVERQIQSDPRYLRALAEQLFPYLLPLFTRVDQSRRREQGEARGSRKTKGPQLPLK